jgi:two-component system, cell cycle sensor histidine kinase and response regulator CckA
VLNLSLLRIDDADHVLTVARDVTRARSAEASRAHLEGQRRQAQKLEAVGRLAAGVAHDFNNLLTVLSANVGLMLDGLPADHPNRVYQEEALETVRRATGLTRQLLAFTRRQAAAPRPVAVDELVLGMERLLGRLVGDDINLELRLSGELPAVRADPGQLEQVLLNLVVNARDAVLPGGHILVETSLVDPPSPAGRAGPHVRIAVRDDGAGMDEETRQHVFEPFFTTKVEGKGTGLGLATVYGVVQQHGGFVAVQSEPGQGACFEVLLPVHSGGTACPG